MCNAWVPNVSPALSTLSLLLLQQTNGWPLKFAEIINPQRACTGGLWYLSGVYTTNQPELIS